MRTRRRPSPSLLVALVVGAVVSAARPPSALATVARADDLPMDPIAAGAVKIDGRIGEWAALAPLQATSTTGAGDDSAAIGFGSDNDGLWVAVDVNKSGPIVAGRGGAQGVDVAIVTIAAPSSLGVTRGPAPLSACELAFYPGTPGRQAGVVERSDAGGAPSPIDAAKIVEAPKKEGGYTLEAFVPWSAIPVARRNRAGIRGGARIRVAEAGKPTRVFSSGAGDASSPGALGFFLDAATSSLIPTLGKRGQSLRDPSFDVRADLLGDGGAERLMVFGTSLIVWGPGFRGGKLWAETLVGAEIADVDVKDVTGDGHADLVLTTRRRAGTTREATVVYAFRGPPGAESFDVIFAHESKVDGDGGKELRDRVTFTTVDGKPGARIAYAPPKGWDVASYREPSSSDIDPILLPWGSVKERTFVVGASGRFERAGESTQAAATATPTSSPTPTSKPAPLVAVTGGADVLTRAIDKYKQAHGVAASAVPRFEVATSMGSDGSAKAAIYGRELVLAVGGGYGGFVSVAMGRFASESDVLSLTAVDLTGDGRDDLIVRGIARSKTTSSTHAEREVLREILVVYAPKGTGSSLALGPVFAVEVARSIDGDRIESSIKWTPARAGASGSFEVTRGKATGWTEKSYPFRADVASGGLEPLLLPWSSDEKLTYAWNGDRFARP